MRSTCHGISAAFGKAGAAIGASAFLKVANMYCPGGVCAKGGDPALQDKGIRVVFICCTVLAVLGFVWTWLLVNDKPHDSLKDAENLYDVEDEVAGEVAALELTIKKAHQALDSTAPPSAEEPGKV